MDEISKFSGPTKLLGYDVTVASETLTLLVGVRIPVSQPNNALADGTRPVASNHRLVGSNPTEGAKLISCPADLDVGFLNR